ncbi:hypothetical protein [Variovorax sp. UMC13]|uniref:hypothetical protein n=1 Tax=Variovorax sp. UMC13 TaxID=1862326 RepID=UPI0016044EA5|nr:hypothetical protein [Variovorax sp. UMC13]
MDKKAQVKEGESSQSVPADHLESGLAQAAQNDESAELHGALPPTDADQQASDADPAAAQKSVSWLNRWGPVKRWTRYIEFKHREGRGPDFWRTQDSEENETGKLGADEGVELPALWVAELYTPSTVGGLLKGIGDLGWEHGRSGDKDLAKWMSDVRGGRQAGWTSLGLVSSPTDPHFMRDRTAKLPPGVTGALPILMSLTPSLTAFIVVFLLDRDTAASLQGPLRAEFQTITRRDPLYRPWHVIRHVLMNGELRLGYSILQPNSLRREAVRSIVQRLEKGCVQWVKDRLPGAFASLPDVKSPSAILLVTEKVAPLSEDARKIRAFHGLALDRDYDAWESDEWPGARLVLPRSWSDEGSRMIFACRRFDAFPDSAGYHDIKSNGTIAYRANDLVGGLLSRWAITCLLDGYHQSLSALRDRTALNKRFRTIRDLKALRTLTNTTLYDISASAQEISEFIDADHSYSYNVMEMNYVRNGSSARHELLNGLKAAQSVRARQLQRDAALLQSTLENSNNLTQTISNIRIQRFVVFLTLISIGIASWALFMSLQTPSP